jgi:Amt family ammonium transporter
VGAVRLGPRLGKFDRSGAPRPLPGHDIALVVLGGLVLWFGWFGFNGGSELAMNEHVARIAVTTALAASFGTAAATGWAWWRTGKPDLTLIVNGALGGLVGVTAACRFIDPWAAAVIGAASGVLVIEAVFFFDRRRIDDPVGALSVHLVCGTFGTLAVGLFGQRSLANVDGFRDGLLYGGGVGQLAVQAQGALATAAFVVGASWLIWLAIDRTLGVRVDAETERTGLDLSEMGMEAYPEPARLDRADADGAPAAAGAYPWARPARESP